MVGSSERFNVDFEWNMQYTIIQGEKVILPKQKWQPSNRRYIARIFQRVSAPVGYEEGEPIIRNVELFWINNNKCWYSHMNTTNIHVRFVKFLIITFGTFFKEFFYQFKNKTLKLM